MAYPPIEPYETGMIDTGDGQQIYWETCGNPDGKPAVVVHGGPGSGCTPGMRKAFDPQRYRIILFDQRGCGRSRPHASDPATDMSTNTTEHLLRDMEQLRDHLGVERWLLWGDVGRDIRARVRRAASGPRFGDRAGKRDDESTYGHRLAVSRRRSFLPRGVGALPGCRRRPRLPAADRLEAGHRRVAVRLCRAHGRRRTSGTKTCGGRVVRLGRCPIPMEANGAPGAYSARVDDARLAFVRICAHYFSHGVFLEEGAILRDAGRLAGIPGVLIHGRQDLGSPAIVAWELARAWPDAELRIIDDSGHTGSDTMAHTMLAALDRFAGT